MNSLAVRGWIAFASLLAVMYAGWIVIRHSHDEAESEGYAATTTSFPSDDQVNDFTLTDQSDQPFGLEQLRGKVWIASFFFASCPGSCRQLNLALENVQEKTPADVMLVSLTCDPENDKPDVLARYAEIFHADPARWKMLTGTMDDLRRVGRDIFKVAFEKGVHSERAFVVDRDGRIRASYSVLDRAQADNLIKFVRELATETAPANTPPTQTQATSTDSPPAAAATDAAAPQTAATAPPADPATPAQTESAASPDSAPAGQP